MRKCERGFTVIELIVFFIILVVLAVVFIVQKSDLQLRADDQTRKTAINSMAADLENVFYKQNKYYPDSISKDNLTAIDPALFTDPNGYTLSGNECDYTDASGQAQTDGDCDYHYAPTGCDKNGHCTGFKLTADMAKEADYEKDSPSAK
ncbi:MAG: type II secretion system GspH family protein [Candidatus Nomurabacteria bacterium]|jgi:Tfp pilus assembly protein PilE|nr:type II secretion system GspH family protein [Candidatus Nomurabacteria bacterium]